jgi:menaquinol-cytochrome c reductase cytochrome b/c subunit
VSNIPLKQSFSKSSGKTYTLVELVHKAPAQMIDHGPEETIFSFPIVALLELLLSLGLGLVLFLLSIAVNAPLEEIANPNITTDPAKAPWYFMGLQEMLEHGHPTLMAVIIPTILVLFVLAIPYIDHSSNGSGRWFTDRRGLKISLYTALYCLVMMPLFITLDNAFPLREILRDVLPPFITQVLIPALILGAIVLIPLLVLRRFRPTARQTMLMLFTILFTSAVIFTITGFLFRGPGFELFWPWNMPGGYNPLKHF